MKKANRVSYKSSYKSVKGAPDRLPSLPVHKRRDRVPRSRNDKAFNYKVQANAILLNDKSSQTLLVTCCSVWSSLLKILMFHSFQTFHQVLQVRFWSLGMVFTVAYHHLAMVSKKLVSNLLGCTELLLVRKSFHTS